MDIHIFGNFCHTYLLLFIEGVSVSVQTEPASPPPFYSEWEEGVRRSVWQPGYLPQPEPPGEILYLATRIPTQVGTSKLV